MNGHWLSGTRKLNKHYQSGQGGDGSFVLSGLANPIMGFEYSGQGERYQLEDRRFYSKDTPKVIAAQTYKIFDNGMPTTYTVENDVHALYAQWSVTRQYGFRANTKGRWNATVPIWRFGEFRGEPYWAYDSSYYVIGCGVDTVVSSNINQNGIDEYALPYFYRQGTSVSFENIYNGYTQDIVIPIYEVVAFPSSGSNMTGIGIIITDGDFTRDYENKIRLKGYEKSGIEIVSGIDTGFNTMPAHITGPDGNVYEYINYGEIYGLTNSRNFLGDCMYSPIFDVNPTTGRNDYCMIAGYHTDPDTSITYQMIYFRRLVRLEKAEYDMSTRVLPFNLP